MQVESGRAYEISSGLIDSRKKFVSKVSASSPLKNGKQLYFGQAAPAQEQEKKGWGFKRISNVGLSSIGVAAIILPTLFRMKRPAITKLLEKNEKSVKNIDGIKDGIEKVIEKTSENLPKKNMFVKCGDYMHKVSTKNKELVNNLIYGFGTVVVMPAVILFSPLGKKESSKEDKWFTVARQPLSFATMFSMQLTMDKEIKSLMPKLIKGGYLEKDNIRDAAKKGELKGNLLQEIRYDEKTLKKAFLEKVGDLKLKDKIDDVLKKGNEKEIKEAFKKLIKGDTSKVAKDSVKLLDNYLFVQKKSAFVKESLVVLANVLFSIPVGCTLLNVIYGKSMKAIKDKMPKSPEQNQENLVKGGTK